MSALVVYESMYGATRAVAEAVAEGLAGTGTVRVVEVGALSAEPGGHDLPDDVDLLVVGGPTHQFGLSRPSSRAEAAKRAPDGLVSAGDGVREWLAAARLPAGLRAAAFDTSILRPRLPGAASRSLERRLRRRGARMVAPPRSFEVDKTGALAEGTLDAARAWGAGLRGSEAAVGGHPGG